MEKTNDPRVSFFTDSLASFWTKTWISNQIGLVKNGKQHCSFWTKLVKHAIVLLCLLVPALLCLCLLSLSGTSKQAQAHKQAPQTHNRKGSSLQLNVLLRLHCVLCTLRLFQTICPKIKSERIKRIKCAWLLTLDRTGFFSCFILKKPHIYFLDKTLWKQPQCTHCCSTQPLHSRVAPLLCLPPLARLFSAWRQVASFYRRMLPGFGLFSPLSFSSVGPFWVLQLACLHGL